jgi:hypothetical protein
MFDSPLAFLELISDAPFGQPEQPAFERTLGPIVLGLRHILHYANDCFLNGVLRLGIASSSSVQHLYVRYESGPLPGES